MNVNKKIAKIIYNTLYYNSRWNMLKIHYVVYEGLFYNDCDESSEAHFRIIFKNNDIESCIPIGITESNIFEYGLNIRKIEKYINDEIYFDNNNGIPIMIKIVLTLFGVRLLNGECEYIWR